MPTPSVQKTIEQEEMGRLFGHLAWARVVAIPVAGALACWLLWQDGSAWRRHLLGGGLAVIFTFFLVEWLRYRRSGLTPHAIRVNLFGAAAGIMVVSFASGGIESPFLVTAVPIAVLTSVLIRPPLQLLVPLFQIAAVWVMAVIGARGTIPDFNLGAFGGGPRVGTDVNHLWAHAGFLTFILVVTQVIGRGVRKTFEAILRRRLAAQQESLRVHQERAEELTALSAEIAHELKNPLASVKGLAGLLSQHLPDGKGAERLGVLRREVDRMQSILDEFLNFSRPLVPLALGDSDVAALCREVAALHEGMAKERGVELLVKGGPVRVRCDPRKVKQVLINLLQNAIDASAPGDEVSLEAGVREGGALVRVLDRGQGVDPSLGEAVFSPGVTTKSSGSGLGLTIARSLARQHGGDLALTPRTGGGTSAELTLPARPGDAEAPRITG
ncbi:MAG: HAMP domain-containing sensor histidine kinase [Anaeromyxobacter sp.]